MKSVSNPVCVPWSHGECFQSSVCTLVSWRVFPIQCVCLGLMESVSNPVCVPWSHGECFQCSVCVPWSHGECFQSSVCALVSLRVFPIQCVCTYSTLSFKLCFKLDWLTSKSFWYTYIVRSAEDLVQNIEINNNYMYLLHHVNLGT